MNIKQIQRLAITIIFTGEEAAKIAELWKQAKKANPRLIQKEVFAAGLQQFKDTKKTV